MVFYKLYKNYTCYTRWMYMFDKIMRSEVYAKARRELENATRKFNKQLALMYAIMANVDPPEKVGDGF